MTEQPQVSRQRFEHLAKEVSEEPWADREVREIIAYAQAEHAAREAAEAANERQADLIAEFRKREESQDRIRTRLTAERDALQATIERVPAQLVEDWHHAFNCPVRTSPTLDVPQNEMRLELIREEFQELRDAVEAGDLVETADALADLVYVVYGAALTWGIPLDACVAEVHRSNMSKLGADGKPVMRADGKVLKGPNYSPPDLKPILDSQLPAGQETTTDAG